MVHITKSNDHFIFEIQGLHKLWSLTSQLKIPVSHIVSVTQDVDSLNGWKGWRAPGTNIPFLLTAGTFHKDGQMIFWDVVNKANCIIVELMDEEYKKLIIEVEDPQTAISLLNEK